MKKRELQQIIRKLTEEVLKEDASTTLILTDDQMKALITVLQRAHSSNLKRVGSVDIFELDQLISRAYDKSHGLRND